MKSAAVIGLGLVALAGLGYAVWPRNPLVGEWAESNSAKPETYRFFSDGTGFDDDMQFNYRVIDGNIEFKGPDGAKAAYPFKIAGIDLRLSEPDGVHIFVRQPSGR